MKVSTREWITKAEEDFAVVNVLTRQRKKPLWSPVCFHAQQCVEKYLKARLNEASLAIHRTHDLEQLLNHVLTIEPLWAAFLPALKRLSDARGAALSRKFHHQGRSAACAEDLQVVSQRSAEQSGLAGKIKLER